MSISEPLFRQKFAEFQQRLATATGGERFEGFRNGRPAAWEGYKGRLREYARSRLNLERWSEGQIGLGEILDCAISAIEITRSDPPGANNLTRWEGRFGHANRSHKIFLEGRNDPSLRLALESALFAHYREAEPAEVSFDRLRGLVGGRYDLLAYLFFLRDWEKFMPIATRTFDRAFAELGIELSMSYNATWENYRAYNAALAEIQDALRNIGGVSDARLVDAHSFCWMLVRPEFAAPEHQVSDGSRMRRYPVRLLAARERSIVLMVLGTIRTVTYSNGQVVETTKKNKDLCMTQLKLEEHVRELLAVQNDRCALTGIPLQWEDKAVDRQLLPSLDRIDSDGHYERGNLQVVCRFVNRWKGADVDDEFRRLLALVRLGGAAVEE